MKLGIILTGTVKPQVVGGNFSIDERMEMYTSTLRFYAKTIGKSIPIVFVENSDVDLSSWKKEFKDILNLEILQFKPDEQTEECFDNSRGKSFNEFLMLKKGIQQSKLLRECNYFLKITGRYAMVNIITMLKEIEKRCTPEIVYMGDIKDTTFYEKLGIKTYSSHWGDTRFFVAQIAFYKQEMINAYQEMCDYLENGWAEHYMVRLSRKYRHDKRFIFKYRHQVVFNGVSGTITSAQLAAGKGTQDSLKMKIKNAIHVMIRNLFPRWLI